MSCHELKETATLPEILEHTATCDHCIREAKQEQAVWELVGKWQEADITPDFKKRFMSKIKETAQPMQTASVRPRMKWFSWDWPEIFVPASAFAAMLIVVVSFFVWTPYENKNNAIEMASTFDLLENKALLTDLDLLSDLDLLMVIDPEELKIS